MSDAKPFAALSSGLLARKGQARPAMRPQGFGTRPSGGDDLGWNDAGRPAPTPAIASEPEPIAWRAPGDGTLALQSRAGEDGKAAFTLRLNGERHLKLRLACALSNRSAQQIVTQALDQFLDAVPDLDDLAGAVPGTAWRAGHKKTKQGVKP